MSLLISEIHISDIRFTRAKCHIFENCLFINKRKIIDLVLEDKRLVNAQVELAKPGQRIRIAPVKDVVEPRAKKDFKTFSGLLEGINELGQGETLALKNCSVITTGPIVGFQEGVIDMMGPLAEYTPFSKLNNIVLILKKDSLIGPHEHEEAVRLAGLRVAEYLASLGLELVADRKRTLDWSYPIDKVQKNIGLPRVAYLCLCMGQGLLHDTYFYGKKIQDTLPSQVMAGEVYDGALVSGNCVSPGSKTTTWHHQNNAVLEECLKRDGTSINFIGMALSPLVTTLKDKYRNAMLATKLIASMKVDGVVISQEGFGNPTTDLMIICRELENRGIKTVLISNEDAGVDGLSEPLPDGVREADALISTGNSNATITAPPMDKFFGDRSAIEKITGGSSESLQEDGSIVLEIHGIMGSHNLQGYSYLKARTV